MAFKLPPWLFWTKSLQKITWDPFWWVFCLAIIIAIPFLRVWWWILLPLMLHAQAKELYFWWVNWDYSYASWRWITLELVPPKETIAPLKAMEDVFSVVWPSYYDQGNFRDIWMDGELDNGPFWGSWEIVSIEGRVHFYLRILSQFRSIVETAFFTHYPDLEIKQVPDYTTLVPPTAPNEEWDVYGEDYRWSKPDYVPMMSYEKTFEEKGQGIKDEKRLDPIISLLELLSRLGPGEHYWVQFITCPVTEYDEPGWIAGGKKEINKIARRPEKKKTSLLDDIMYVMSQLILGPKIEGAGPKAKVSWTPQTEQEEDEGELKLTPDERELLTEMEKKLRKPVFRTTVRGVYVAKRESWKSGNRILLRSYMAHWLSNKFNSFTFAGVPTRPKINYFMRKRRVFLRARKMFRHAVKRLPPTFPNRMASDFQPIISIEEMATLYHFPVRMSGMVSPTLEKVQAKKAGPPQNLPIG